MSYDIKMVNLDHLIPYINNSRTHSNEQVSQIAASIKEFGFTNPVLIDESMSVIAGHGRIKAAQKLNLSEVPCITLSGLTEQQRKAYVIADNQLALNAGWDLEKLKLEVGDLECAGFDIDLLGFEDDFLTELMVDEEEGQCDQDQVPEVAEEPIAVRGDVWLLGDHRLMCGDSCCADDVAKLLAGQKPNTMITDPPYGVEYKAGSRAEAKGTAKTAREVTSEIMNDDRADWHDAYSLFPGTVAYVWHAPTFTDVVMDGLRRSGFEIKQQIIWNKNVHALGMSDFQWKHEPCWYALRPEGDRNWKGDRTQMTVWNIKSVIFEKDKTAHPTQKPVEIYTKPLELHTNRGEYVYEPFGGSGSSIIACEKLERRSLTMELDPKFCDVIIKRWQNYTGQVEKHEESGLPFMDCEAA